MISTSLVSTAAPAYLFSALWQLQLSQVDCLYVTLSVCCTTEQPRVIRDFYLHFYTSDS